MEVEKKSGRGKKEVSLIGLFGKQFLEEMQNKLAEATGVSFLLFIIKESQLQREKRKKSFVRKERRKMKSVVNVRLAGHLLQRRVRLKTVHIFLPVQMDLYIWQFRLL